MRIGRDLEIVTSEQVDAAGGGADETVFYDGVTGAPLSAASLSIDLTIADTAANTEFADTAGFSMGIIVDGQSIAALFAAALFVRFLEAFLRLH